MSTFSNYGTSTSYYYTTSSSANYVTYADSPPESTIATILEVRTGNVDGWDGVLKVRWRGETFKTDQYVVHAKHGLCKILSFSKTTLRLGIATTPSLTFSTSYDMIKHAKNSDLKGLKVNPNEAFRIAKRKRRREF